MRRWQAFLGCVAFFAFIFIMMIVFTLPFLLGWL